jgi:tRNA pseudouridine38-40 synthase
MSPRAAPESRRWKCVCAYNGAEFAGWQSQELRSRPAIQDVIEKRLAAILGAPVRIHGSGRTDSGVHARGQVFHFDAPWRHGREKFLAAFRVGLPASIQIQSIREAPPGFHARFSAKGKIYSYHLCLGDADPFTRPAVWSIFRPLDLAAMEKAAAFLRGRHDFRAFSATRGGGEEDSVRNLRRLELRRRGRRVTIIVEGDGFLYKMARSLVGALVSVGEGKLAPEQLRDMLRSRHRTAAVLTAPPQGLFLEKVLY